MDDWHPVIETAGGDFDRTPTLSITYENCMEYDLFFGWGGAPGERRFKQQEYIERRPASIRSYTIQPLQRQRVPP